MRPGRVAAGLAAAALLSWLPATVSGQGSSVYTQSACMSALSGAGVARPCEDGSAIYYNPAALAVQPGAIGLGVTGVWSGGDFTYDLVFGDSTVERETALTPVPHGYATVGLPAGFGAGVGVWAPFGLGLEWPLGFEGRYVGYDNSLRGLYVQPTLAYAFADGRVSIGAGADIVLTSLAIRQRLDAAELSPLLAAYRGVDAADAELEGSGTGFGFHVGTLVRITDALWLGARYMHSVPVDLEGDADFEPVATNRLFYGFPGAPGPIPLDTVLAPQFRAGGALVDQALAGDLEFPAQAVVGLAFSPNERWELMIDYQWTGWSSFDEIPIDFESLTTPDETLLLEYEDTHGVRVGGALMATDRITVRGGFSWNTAATPDETVTPLLPEAERATYSAGVSWDPPGAFAADAMYYNVSQADRRGRVRGREAGQTAEDLNVGVYTSTGHLLGVTLSYRLGWPFGGRTFDR